MRDIMFVPHSMRLPDLLVQMQGRRIHIALVVDEYGGIDGVVCLEDSSRKSSATSRTNMTAACHVVLRRGRSVWDIDGLADIDDVERATGLTLAHRAVRGRGRHDRWPCFGAGGPRAGRRAM